MSLSRFVLVWKFFYCKLPESSELEVRTAGNSIHTLQKINIYTNPIYTDHRQKHQYNQLAPESTLLI